MGISAVCKKPVAMIYRVVTTLHTLLVYEGNNWTGAEDITYRREQ